MSGSLNHSPAKILAELLIDLGQATRVSASGSWPVYINNLPDTPDECINITDTTGKHDGRSMVTGKVFQHYGFQILGRSQNNNTVFQQMNNIAVALDEQVNRTFVPIGSDTYRIQSITRDAIIYVGFDEVSRRRIYSLNGFVALRQMAGTGSY